MILMSTHIKQRFDHTNPLGMSAFHSIRYLVEGEVLTHFKSHVNNIAVEQ